MKELIQMRKGTYTREVWCEHFLQLVMVPLKKKSHATTFKGYITTSLLTHASSKIVRTCKSPHKEHAVQSGNIIYD